MDNKYNKNQTAIIAKRIFERDFSIKKIAIDFSGREIIKELYNVKGIPGGWGLLRALPKSLGGTDSEDNMVACSFETINERGNKTCFWANGKSYHVVKYGKGYAFEMV